MQAHLAKLFVGDRALLALIEVQKNSTRTVVLVEELVANQLVG